MILIILFLLFSMVALAYAAYCSAVQDTVLHHFESSIFFIPETTKKKYGFNWNWWYRSDWKNKWILDDANNVLKDVNGDKVPRVTKILFWKIQLVQFYDAWHHYKMIKIGMNVIADIVASVTAVMIYINFHPAILAWVLIALAYFIIQSFIWNWMFNNNYNKWLLKPQVK